MKPALFLRIAAVLTFVHAVLHTVGGVFGDPGPGPATTAVQAMKMNQFLLMGHARGVLCLAAGAHGVAVEALAHSLVKRALVGSGAARKEQVKRMVVQLLGLRTLPEPDDVSDALALAIAFAHRDGRHNGGRVL